MTHISLDVLKQNVRSVKNRITKAASSCGRNAKHIQLISVAKTFPASYTDMGFELGLTNFGENRIQEAIHKIEQLPTLPITWHFIGHLQTNKARTAATYFDWIHSVDTEKLLKKLNQVSGEVGKTPQVLIQVDLAGEATKHGATVDKLRSLFETAMHCSALKVRGLMLVPPWNSDPETTRPYFQKLRNIRDTLKLEGFNENALGELSMGMSHDFEVAIEEGSTMIRVGTALFGKRGK
tara:strand:- start:1436 stop:2146 length:711 start_codon:yes stop_codon:yes gene_type:complete